MLQPEQFFRFGFKSQDVCYLFHDAIVFQYVKLLFRTLPQRDLNTPFTLQSLQSYRTIFVVDKESQFWGILPTVFLEPLWDALPQAEWWILDGLGSPQHWHTSRITQKPILKTDQPAYSPIDPQRTYKKLHYWVEFQKRYIPQAKPIQTIKWCSTTTHAIPIALQLFQQYYEETTSQSLLFRRTLLGLLHDTTTPDGILHIPFESLYHAHPRLYLQLSYTAYLRHLILLIEDAFPQCPWVMEQDFPDEVEKDAKQLRQWRGCYISQQQQPTTMIPRDQCFYYAVSPQYYQTPESRSLWVRLFWRSFLAQPWVEWRQVEWENPSHPPPDCVFLSSPIEPTPTAYQGLTRFIIDPERRHSHQVLPNTYIIQWDTTPSCQGIQWSGAVITLPVGIDPAFWRWYEMFHNAITSPIQLIQGEYLSSSSASFPASSFRYWIKRSNSQQQQVANLIETADELEWVFGQAGHLQPTEFQPTWTQTEHFLFRASSFRMGTQSSHILKITPYEVYQWRQTATFVALLCGVKPSLHASLFEFRKRQNPPLLPQHPQWIPFADIAWEEFNSHHLQTNQTKKQLSLSREWLRGDIWRDVVQQVSEHTSRRLSLLLYIWYVNAGMYRGVYPRRRSFTTQKHQYQHQHQQQQRILLWNTGVTPPFNSEGHRYLIRHFEDETAFTTFQVLPLLTQQFHYYRLVDATLPFISWEWEGQYPQQTPMNQIFVIENEWETFHDPEKTRAFSLLREGSQPRSHYVKSQTALMDCLMDARFQNPNIQTDTVYDPIAPVQVLSKNQFNTTTTVTQKLRIGCVVSSQEEMQWVSSLRKHHPHFTFLIYYLHEGTTQQERESLLYQRVDMVCEASKTRQFVVLEALNHCLPVCMRIQNPLSVDIMRECEANALPFPGVVIQYDELTNNHSILQHTSFYQESWVESATQCAKTQWNPKYMRWLWSVSFTPSSSQSLSVYPQITLIVLYYQLEEWDLEGILQTIQQQVGFGRLYELEVFLISNGNHHIYRHQKLIEQYREVWEEATNGFVRVKEYHREEHEKQTERVYHEALKQVSYKRVFCVEGRITCSYTIIEQLYIL